MNDGAPTPAASSTGSVGMDAGVIDAAELRDSIGSKPVISSETAFSGMVWNVRRDTVDLGDDDAVTREYVEHPGAVVIAPYRETPDGEAQVLVIEQYRHPVGVMEWEFPAGLLDVDGEDPAAAAARELAEEVDLVAARWDVLVDYYSSPGGMTEAMRVFLAREFSPVPAEQRHERDAEEKDMRTAWVDLDVAVEAALSGRLGNPGCVVGLLAVNAARGRGWSTLRPADAPWPQHPGRREH